MKDADTLMRKETVDSKTDGWTDERLMRRLPYCTMLYK
jgi:hypothetical protein